MPDEFIEVEDGEKLLDEKEEERVEVVEFEEYTGAWPVPLAIMVDGLLAVPEETAVDVVELAELIGALPVPAVPIKSELGGMA
ncbi:MAG: hypothetical protein M1827_000434 [Pycnora praestabilis]|nr:MAG: hypothetical protein M1827_000434 [Pycnora praestabilis]